MTQKRIALVSAFPPGKVTLNEYGYHFAKALASLDEVGEVIVIADKLETPLPELDLGPKVSVKRVWSFNSPATPFAILGELRRIAPDAAIYNTQTAAFGDREVPAALGLMTPVLSRLFGIKSGIVAHNLIGGIDLEGTVLSGRKLRQALVKLGGAAITRAMTWANYMTVTVQSYADLLAEHSPKADVTVVPHGTFEAEEQPWVPQAARPMRIITMGKFGTYKKLDTMLAAFDELRRDPGLPEIELVIGGSDHPNTPGYIDSVMANRQDDPNITFQGYIPEEDVPAFFQNARVAVFDYTATTGSSGVLHQAASFGTLPVFPRIGDFVDLCRDEGLDGGSFTPANSTELAAVIRDLLRDQDGAESLAQSNHRAAMSLPISQVAAWHIDKINSLSGQRAQAA